MAQVLISSSPCIYLISGTAVKFVQPCALVQLPNSCSRISYGLASPFKHGSPLFFATTFRKRNLGGKAKSLSIKCEQGAKESNGLDVWLGRFAMVGFATAIAVEVATGKGLLENFGLVSPLPTLALILTAVVGVLTAFFIFQSASQD